MEMAIVRGTKGGTAPRSIIKAAKTTFLLAGGMVAAVPPGLRNKASLLLLPWTIFAINRNWPFQGLGHMDPWYYFGEFIHFPHYQKLISGYAGERLMWILPGVVLDRVFSPVYGLLVLHILFYSISVL